MELNCPAQWYGTQQNAKGLILFRCDERLVTLCNGACQKKKSQAKILKVLLFPIKQNKA